MLWRALRPVPDVVRRAASGILTRIDTRILDGAYHWSKPILPKSLRFHNVGGKVRRFAELLPVRDSAALYERLITLWDDPRVVRGAIAEGDAVPTRPDGIGDLIGSLMRYETETYLPDDILVKLDRATMAVSLEAREPLLDRALFELAWRLPPRMKVRDGEGKWILKKVLLRHLPHELVARPKMGFAVPIGHWLRGPLREWAEDLLNPRRLEEGGVFDPAIVGAVWQEHCVGVRNRESLLWAVLMFESWRTQRGGASG
jgi:asparagine synthase (glutamine-hydrolysing)